MGSLLRCAIVRRPSIIRISRQRGRRRAYRGRVTYTAEPARYDAMPYRRCGRSGLSLPAISLGLWHNFGGDRPLDVQRAILRRAFDLGVTHIDLANNYGPPYGSAEANFGRLLDEDFRPYRDELVISTKAGYDMWPGPYGDHGSRKYLLASLDQSLGADGSGLCGHLLLAPRRPGHAARGDDGRAGHGGAPGQGPLRRHLVLLSTADGRGDRDPAGARHAAADPPAVLLDAQPVDRDRRAARRPGRGGCRLHRLLAARPGHADRPLPRRHPGRIAGQRGELAGPGLADRRQPGEGAGARRDRRPRADSRWRRWRWRGRCATPG